MRFNQDRDKLTPFERELEKKLVRSFNIIKKEMIPLIRTVTTKQLSRDIINLAVSIVGKRIVEDVNEVSLDSFIFGATQVSDQLNIGISFDLVNKQASNYLANRQGIIQGLNETTTNKIRNLLVRVVENDLSFQEAQKELRNTYWLSPRRAELIATNELGHAYVQGSNRTIRTIALEQGLKTTKKWDNVGDSNVTDGCRYNEAEGFVELEHVYPNYDGLGGGKEPPRFVGCRCTLIYELD